MLGSLGLRIFEATSADVADLGEEHGHRVLRVCGKGTKYRSGPLPHRGSRYAPSADSYATPVNFEEPLCVLL
jgi:site-specific recombinase XerC